MHTKTLSFDPKIALLFFLDYNFASEGVEIKVDVSCCFCFKVVSCRSFHRFNAMLGVSYFHFAYFVPSFFYVFWSNDFNIFIFPWIEILDKKMISLKSQSKKTTKVHFIFWHIISSSQSIFFSESIIYIAIRESPSAKGWKLSSD